MQPQLESPPAPQATPAIFTLKRHQGKSAELGGREPSLCPPCWVTLELPRSLQSLTVL